MKHLERVQNPKIDLLICCGDFQLQTSISQEISAGVTNFGGLRVGAEKEAPLSHKPHFREEVENNCLGRSKPSMEFLHGPRPFQYRFDEEWLAITRAYHPYLPLTRSPFTSRLTIHEKDNSNTCPTPPFMQAISEIPKTEAFFVALELMYNFDFPDVVSDVFLR
ncbi:hypothetical protein R1flu_019911 [Riccia fluitans]|uniref:Uncharacterized protein n=1 Tax=Riccia fluitans TaxID=41844 RepID=A0ABD1ZK86_9MARC